MEVKGVARMTRQEFIVTLREGIKKLPPEEIVAATEYFEEYFDETLEAGEKTEEEIIEELGNPKKIAAQIKADYAARILDGDETVLGEKPTVKKKISAVWWVIIGIVSAPVSIPIASGIAAVAFAILTGVIAGVIGVAATGVGCIVLGCMALNDVVSTGILFWGVGLICLAAAVAAGMGVFIGVRAAVRKIAQTIRRRRENRERERLAEMSGGRSEWVYASRPDDDEKEFMEEMAADAAEAQAAAEAEIVPIASATDETIELTLPEEIKAVEGGEENE